MRLFPRGLLKSDFYFSSLSPVVISWRPRILHKVIKINCRFQGLDTDSVLSTLSEFYRCWFVSRILMWCASVFAQLTFRTIFSLSSFPRIINWSQIFVFSSGTNVPQFYTPLPVFLDSFRALIVFRMISRSLLKFSHSNFNKLATPSYSNSCDQRL